jgi:hypothetical protein
MSAQINLTLPRRRRVRKSLHPFPRLRLPPVHSAILSWLPSNPRTLGDSHPWNGTKRWNGRQRSHWSARRTRTRRPNPGRPRRMAVRRRLGFRRGGNGTPPMACVDCPERLARLQPIGGRLQPRVTLICNRFLQPLLDGVRIWPRSHPGRRGRYCGGRSCPGLWAPPLEPDDGRPWGGRPCGGRPCGGPLRPRRGGGLSERGGPTCR